MADERDKRKRVVTGYLSRVAGIGLIGCQTPSCPGVRWIEMVAETIMMCPTAFQKLGQGEMSSSGGVGPLVYRL